MSNESKKPIKVSNTEDLRLALAAGYEAGQIEVDNSAAVAAARAEGVAEGRGLGAPDVEAARVAAVTAERARIAAVQKLSRPGFEAIVNKGIEDGTSASDVALAILTEAADRGVTLDAIRKDAPPAAPHAKNPNDDKPDAAATAASWDAAVAKSNKPQRN